ncbi:MAG: hypothetical protein HQM16_14085 [Deltaproteobacteria bacterium]|nr:hypothetical protein [Deltaproteobacteria bacterium]
MNPSYLVIDPELKQLFEKFIKHHPEGSKPVLKLVLKMYLKLMDKSKHSGTDPLLIFQNLVDRIVSGRLYETTKDKIDHLNSMLEDRAVAGGGSEPLVSAETREIKSMIRDQLVGGVTKKMEDFAPKDGAKLVKVGAVGPEQRKNYRDVRKEKNQKKIDF